MPGQQTDLAEWSDAPDIDLIVCCLAGDYSAFDELFARYNDFYLDLANQIGNDPVGNVREMWLTVCEHLDQLETSHLFRIYSLGVLLNLTTGSFVNPWDLENPVTLRSRIATIDATLRIRIHVFLEGFKPRRSQMVPMNVHSRVSIARKRLQESP